MKHIHCSEAQWYDAPELGLEGTQEMKLCILSDDSVQIALGEGGHTPDHIHDDKERLVVISGNGIIRFKTEQIEIRPDDFIEIDKEQHQIVNTGTAPLVFMAFRNQ